VRSTAIARPLPAPAAGRDGEVGIVRVSAGRRRSRRHLPAAPGAEV